MRRLVYAVSIIILTAADYLLKLLALNRLKPVDTVDFIPGVLGLRYVENTGAAFGSLSDRRALLCVITALALVAGLVYIFSGKIKYRIPEVCGVLIIAGGLGNLIDRVFRGYVVDYIEPLFVKFAVFNFADSLITVGAFALIIWLIVGMVRDAKTKKAVG